MAHTLHSNTSAPSFADRLNTFKTEIKAAFARRKVYSKTYAELAGLTNRELADLGIHRSAIRRLALEAAQMV